MSKPTPGPWCVADDAAIWAATPDGPTPICQCEDLNADAALIAAAPDLLAFAASDDLDWLLTGVIHGDLNGDVPEHLNRMIRINTMRHAAIAKAKGEQP